MSYENNRGIVLCFLIYIALCATIVSIIERPWLIVPLGTPLNVSYLVYLNPNFQLSTMYELVLIRNKKREIPHYTVLILDYSVNRFDVFHHISRQMNVRCVTILIHT